MNTTALPRVSEDTGRLILHEISGGNQDYITILFKKVERDNPEIAEMIRQISLEHCEANEEEMPVVPLGEAITMALMVYRQLESQAEADELKKVFGF